MSDSFGDRKQKMVHREEHLEFNQFIFASQEILCVLIPYFHLLACPDGGLVEIILMILKIISYQTRLFGAGKKSFTTFLRTPSSIKPCAKQTGARTLERISEIKRHRPTNSLKFGNKRVLDQHSLQAQERA